MSFTGGDPVGGCRGLFIGLLSTVLAAALVFALLWWWWP